MSQFDSLIYALRNENYSQKCQLLYHLFDMIQNSLNNNETINQEDKNVLLAYAYEEVDTFIVTIQNTNSYQEKVNLFACADMITKLVMYLCPNSNQLPQDNLEKIRILVETVAKERCIETTIDDLITAGDFETRI